MDGIAATAALRRLDAPPQVIVLTTFQADEQVMSALRAGASGFLLKDTPPAEIINAVRLVAAGDAMLSPSVTRTLLSHFGDRRRRPSAAEPPRSDWPRSPTASVRSRSRSGPAPPTPRWPPSLFMSEATVKAHVSRLFTKLDVANRVQIAIVVHDADQS